MTDPKTLPYKIAVLCYLFDDAGRLLLLHRVKPPNQHLYSPVGGKLDIARGESPAACAAREIDEEAGVAVDLKDLHLTGIVSESAYRDEAHWLMFLYEVTRPVRVQRTTFEEGRLEWYRKDEIDRLAIPETDRRVIWPLFWRYRGRFFCAHIACHSGGFDARLEQPASDAGPL